MSRMITACELRHVHSAGPLQALFDAVSFSGAFVGVCRLAFAQDIHSFQHA